MDGLQEVPIWSVSRKIAFRFMFCFLAAYLLPWSLLGTIWDAFMYLTGRHLLHIGYPVNAVHTGSGDTTYNYVETFLYALIAVAGCLVWSIADCKRQNYQRLNYWMRVVVRYYLAYMLVMYGYAKLFKSQFPYPDLARLNEPYGESSPMGLAWTFLGFSGAYNIFMGFFEAIGGVLMFFRRTSLLGACIALTMVVNITVLNFCYDIPVKLFSCTLVLMSIIVLWGDMKRLVAFFVGNKTTLPPPAFFIEFKTRAWKVSRVVLKSLMIAIVVGLGFYDSVTMKLEDTSHKRKPSLYGVYDVMTFVQNGDTLSALTGNQHRWSQVIIPYDNRLRIRKMDESVYRLDYNLDTAKREIILTSDNDEHLGTFFFHKPDSTTLMLTGSMKADSPFVRQNDSVVVVLHRQNPDKYRLMNRGFHWINEYPFNR